MASLPATRWSPTGRTSCKEARTLSREAVHRARTRQHPSRERWNVQQWDRKNQGQQNLGGVRIVHLNGEQAAIQPGNRTEPDDLDEFIWQFGDHTAVRTRSEH